MSETYGGEQNSENVFFEDLGLMNASEIERAYELKEIYLDALCEIMPIDRQQLIAEARFVEDLGADSLAVLEVLEILQDKLDVDLPTEAFDGIGTVGGAFKEFYKISANRPDGGPDDNLSGDREPRNPIPSAPSGSVHKDPAD